MIWLSIRFCPPVTKLNVPILPLRIGTGFSASGVWATLHRAARIDRHSANTCQADRCRHRHAVFPCFCDKMNSTATLEWIVFQSLIKGNITEVTVVSLGMDVSCQFCVSRNPRGHV